MTTSDNDRELRKLFEQLREHDQLSTSSFRQTLSRSKDQRPGNWRALFLRTATVLVFFGLLGSSLYLAWQPKRQDPAGVSVSLSDWRAPTDVLLKVPGLEMIESTPVIPSALSKLSPIYFKGDFK